jgi:hypothetical protein
MLHWKTKLLTLALVTAAIAAVFGKAAPPFGIFW